MKVFETRFSQFKSRKRKQSLIECPACCRKWWTLSQNIERIKSCGCVKPNRKKHGLSKTRQYNTWKNMLQRCVNPNYSIYKYYGGRGITVCNEWQTFEGFWKDMSVGYGENLTIDRINTNGNYSKDNCRWSTMAEQVKNRRNM